MRNSEIPRCSFCQKPQNKVAKLISSPVDHPGAYICDECVAVCRSILEDEADTRPSSARHPGEGLVDNALRVLKALADGSQPSDIDLVVLERAALPEDQDLGQARLAAAIILREIRKRLGESGGESA
jgi:hypothetical protein